MRQAAWAAALATTVAACGHKGNPQPPDRPAPPPVEAFVIEKTGTAVVLRFTVPIPDAEKGAPRLVERVDVYALSKPVADLPPAPVELAVAAHLISRIDAPAPPKLPQSASSVAHLVSGTLTFTDTITATAADAAAVRYYAVQAVNGRRRGPLSPILKVPVATTLDVPANIVAEHDERLLSLSWAPGPAGVRFVLDQTDASGGGARRVTPAPLEVSKFEAPVEFGKARCFVVRAIQTSGNVTLIGDGAAPVCVTPVDRFPPPVPADLVALAGDTGVELAWAASAARDLAGYVVLRAEGANGTLQPLTPAPIAATSYRDETARSGVTYQYAVKAVDGAGNESGLSNRYSVTARHPGDDVTPRERRER
jgi:hypothetical protein